MSIHPPNCCPLYTGSVAGGGLLFFSARRGLINQWIIIMVWAVHVYYSCFNNHWHYNLGDVEMIIIEYWWYFIFVGLESQKNKNLYIFLFLFWHFSMETNWLGRRPVKTPPKPCFGQSLGGGTGHDVFKVAALWLATHERVPQSSKRRQKLQRDIFYFIFN